MCLVQGPSLHATLRGATRVAHARIERALQLSRAEQSLDAYATLLQSLYGYYAPLEARLRCFPVAEQLLEQRSKLGWLKADLVALGRDASALPCAARLPHLSSDAAVFGCLYVMEGSSLGAQIISRRLHDGLGVSAGDRGTFFGGYGAHTRQMWSAFLARLNALPSPHDDALTAAVATFSSLESWLLETLGTA